MSSDCLAARKRVLLKRICSWKPNSAKEHSNVIEDLKLNPKFGFQTFSFVCNANFACLFDRKVLTHQWWVILLIIGQLANDAPVDARATDWKCVEEFESLPEFFDNKLSYLNLKFFIWSELLNRFLRIVSLQRNPQAPWMSHHLVGASTFKVSFRNFQS